MSPIETAALLLVTPLSALLIGWLVLRDARRMTAQAHARAKTRHKSDRG
ncbi:hypothetical protein [Jiella marina]|nr:hypothetical protein [Jiella sp. LLJ827]MCQ0989981.1 hypothetical protein [Jiella sp. LLJ827]